MMNKKLSKKQKGLAFLVSVLMLSFVANYFAFAWTEPNLAPPGCNPGDPGCDAPVNVSGSTQYKSGALGIGGLFETDTDAYLAITGGNVGIGTTSPIRKLHIVGGPNEATVVLDEASNVVSEVPDVFLRRARGTQSVPLDVQVGDRLGSVSFFGYKNGNYAAVTSSTITSEVESFIGNIVRSGIAFKMIRTDGVNVEEKMRIDADGNVGIGTTTPASKLEVIGRIRSSSNTEDGVTVTVASDTAISNPLFVGARSRGTLLSPLPVNPGDTLWEAYAMGYDKINATDGDSFNPSGQIVMEVDGAVESDSVPGRITFGTTPANGNNIITRMTIKNDGKVGIGTTTPASTLDVNGNLKISGTTEGIGTAPDYAGLYIPNADIIVGGGPLSVFGFRHIDVPGNKNLITFGNQDIGGSVNGPVAMTIDSEFRRVGVGLIDTFTRPNANFEIKMSNAAPAEGVHISRNAVMGFSYLNIEDEVANPIFKVHESGNVGIGTQNPRAILDIVGNEVLIDSGPVDGSPEINFIDSSGTGDVSWRIGSGTGNYLSFSATNPADWNTSLGPWGMTLAYNTARNSTFVGTGTSNPQGAMDIVSTTGALIVPRMNAAQRDALTAINGMIIYNTTTNQFNFRENGVWVSK